MAKIHRLLICVLQTAIGARGVVSFLGQLLLRNPAIASAGKIINTLLAGDPAETRTAAEIIDQSASANRKISGVMDMKGNTMRQQTGSMRLFFARESFLTAVFSALCNKWLINDRRSGFLRQEAVRIVSSMSKRTAAKY